MACSSFMKFFPFFIFSKIRPIQAYKLLSIFFSPFFHFLFPLLSLSFHFLISTLPSFLPSFLFFLSSLSFYFIPYYYRQPKHQKQIDIITRNSRNSQISSLHYFACQTKLFYLFRQHFLNLPI